MAEAPHWQCPFCARSEYKNKGWESNLVEHLRTHHQFSAAASGERPQQEAPLREFDAQHLPECSVNRGVRDVCTCGGDYRQVSPTVLAGLIEKHARVAVLPVQSQGDYYKPTDAEANLLNNMRLILNRFASDLAAPVRRQERPQEDAVTRCPRSDSRDGSGNVDVELEPGRFTLIDGKMLPHSNGEWVQFSSIRGRQERQDAPQLQAIRNVIADFVRSCREKTRTVQVFDVLADYISGERPSEELEAALLALPAPQPPADRKEPTRP